MICHLLGMRAKCLPSKLLHVSLSPALLQGLILVFPPRYHLKDVIVGKIYFLLVRIKIKHMEIDIIKRETTGTGPNVYHENDTIAKYEIMDGAPVRGERHRNPQHCSPGGFWGGNMTPEISSVCSAACSTVVGSEQGIDLIPFLLQCDKG